MNTHKTTKLWYPLGKRYVDIDTKISALIGELWAANIWTVMSCENNTPEMYDWKDNCQDTCIWIEFLNDESLEQFLLILCIDLDHNDPMVKKVKGHEFYDGKRKLPYWDHRLYIDTDPYDEDESVQTINITHQLRFPGSDYWYVLDRMRNYNMKIINETTDEEYEKIINLFNAK